MTHPDKNLLFLISENARTKIKDLAFTLKKSQPLILYTLKQMSKEKIILNPHCIIDYSYLGLLLFRVYFKGGYVAESDKAAIIKKLVNNPYIVSIYELSGEFDLAVDIEAPNPSRFNKELKRIGDMIPTLNNYKIILNLVTHIYPREYLLKQKQSYSQSEQEIIIGGDRKIQQFSDNELEVMKQLVLSPMTRYTKLAKRTRLNVKTARTVFGVLQKRKVIKGFKFDIDTNALNINKVRLFIGLHNIRADRERELMVHMLKTPEIIQVNKTVGDWDLEIDIESPDKARVRAVTLKIRESFKEIIERFNMIEFYKYYKRSYLPMYLFIDDLSSYLPMQKQMSLTTFTRPRKEDRDRPKEKGRKNVIDHEGNKKTRKQLIGDHDDTPNISVSK